jgi:signal transduction histidine kinase
MDDMDAVVIHSSNPSCAATTPSPRKAVSGKGLAPVVAPAAPSGRLGMSLAVRLLIAFAAVAVLVTALVGFFARDVARREVEHSFEQRIEAAMLGARNELVFEAGALRDGLAGECETGDLVGRALLGLQRAKGDITKIDDVALPRMVSSAMQLLRVNQLLLVDEGGRVIVSDDPARQGTRDRLAARMIADPRVRAQPRIVEERGVARMIALCTRSEGGLTVGLVGTRTVEPVLERIGKAYGVALAREASGLAAPGKGSFAKRLRINEIEGLVVRASISKQPLTEALAQLDSTIFLTGAIAVLLSVALAVFLARSLSQPLVELAVQTREVVRGSPQPVPSRGGREIRHLAKSFNETIEELTRMRNRLARTERIAARREVARQVAHEIKNPLAPIRAAIETLRRLHARDSPHFEDYFDEATKTVLEEVHRIKHIVGEFTEFARMPPPAFVEVDLEEMARGVVALHDAKEDSAGPEVTLEMGEVPAVLADQSQLVQVLTNLVQNGIEASAEDGRPARVRVMIAQRGARDVAIAVEDDGPGVAPEVKARLFEPYVSTKKEGTGLGLAIVQTILHEHGGDITHEDPEGGGARFVVVLPIKGPPLLEQAPSSGNTG